MKILLGVTGCIGAYKSAQILRLFQSEGVDVVPVMTQNAGKFIGPLTLNKLSGHPVLLDPFLPGSGEIEHISLARSSSLLLVAPATANILAKFAAGVADDFLSTLYLSTTTPVMVAPAMNVEMWNHPATRRNVEVLKERGVHFVGPDSGYQACGESGEGRLAEPEEIVRQALAILNPATSLKGCRVLVTAGPTVEDIDPVRFISNRSSGKMGYAIAFEAHRRGAAVDLVSGPTRIEPPRGVNLHRVRSASEMFDRVLELFPHADIIVKAAAVADLTPRNPHLHKIKKLGNELRLDLIPTVDILLELTSRKRQGQIIVGFAAESENLIGNAREKMQRKQLDMVVANNIAAVNDVFNSDQNEVVILDRNRSEISIPRASKNEVSKRIWDQIELLREESGKAAPQR